MTAELNPQYRLDTFVVGGANRLAVTAARAVAESPGTAYNPLFIYARPGLGKTHLLMGIGQAARAINPRLSAEYLTLDEFVESFHAAIAAGQGELYRRRFAEVDLLLVDDVQFLSQRREMQAELLRLTDAMQTANRQIILTSDRPPSEIEALDERLIRRFAGGLVMDIAEPDYETRVAILRRKAEEREVTFAEGVIEAVATAEINNVRELVGALNRLIAFQAVSDRPLEPAQAEALLGPSLTTAAPRRTPSSRPTASAVNPGPAAAPPAAPTPPRAGPVPPRPTAVEPAAKEAAPPPAREPDEFGEFLSEVSATVAHQVESWRARVAEAVLRWEGDGYRVHRLTALLERDVPEDPEAVLRAFERDVERIQELQEAAAAYEPALAGSAVFRDPDNIEAAEAMVQRAREGATPPPGPSPLWQLDDFGEGPNNRMAVQAARAVVGEPGRKYNPLVLLGPSGMGKTHLLHAVGNALAEGAAEPIACLGAQDFVAEIIEAIDRDRMVAWRGRYRHAAALLLDDVHLLAGKERSQEELFLLFNYFLEQERQMIFTSATPLASLGGIENRLLTRLEGGLVVELPLPEREVRATVVERLLAAKGVEAGRELAEYLAGRPVESVRALQGLVQRVLNAAEVGHEPASAALARRVLEGTPAHARRSGGVRSSGVVIGHAGGVRSREKTIWSWPDPTERLVEEWR